MKTLTKKINQIFDGLGLLTPSKAQSLLIREAGPVNFFSSETKTYHTLWDVCLVLCFVLLFSPSSFAEISLKAIAQIESSGNPSAIGDNGRSLGLYQISQYVVEDYNRFHNTQYSHDVALDSIISEKIASWYLNAEIPRLLRHFKKPVTLENQIIAYNCGIGCVVKGRLPLTTQNYLKKYRRLHESA
jgi:hypothetical protein